jgi:hypothetical protein
MGTSAWACLNEPTTELDDHNDLNAALDLVVRMTRQHDLGLEEMFFPMVADHDHLAFPASHVNSTAK